MSFKFKKFFLKDYDIRNTNVRLQQSGEEKKVFIIFHDLPSSKKN